MSVVKESPAAKRLSASAPPRETIVVVGNGMAGHAFCERLCRHEAARGQFRVIVIGEEPRPAYDRVNLTKYLSGTTVDELLLSPREWYIRNSLHLLTGDPVEQIDRGSKYVVTRGGLRLPYDYLVMATGSRPFVPPFEGASLPGVFVYRTIEDLEAIRNYSKQAKTAAVLGGGFLGLEAAEALQNLELEPHVLEVAPTLMPRQLDPEGGLLLQRTIEELGVHVHTQVRVSRIENVNPPHGDGDKTDGQRQPGRLALYTGDEHLMTVDMVVVSAGIRPRDELARSCELTLGERGGIAVDTRLRTSDPAIRALGECAAHRDKIYGLAGPAFQMAEVLAANFAGLDDEFLEGDQSARLKLMDVDVVTLGEPLGEVSGVNVISTSVDGAYRKILLRRNRIAGAMGVGPWPEIEIVREAIESGWRIWRWNQRRFENTGRLWREDVATPVTAWPEKSIICSCTGVTRGQLSCAIAGGCQTLESIQTATRASTVCGSCTSLVNSMLGAANTPAPRMWRPLLVASIVAVALLIVAVLAPPVPFASSMQDAWRSVDLIWRNTIARQITGYTLLGVSVAAVTLSLRKRFNLLASVSYATWRAAHAIIGTLAIAGMLAHTGLSLGSNLNLLLALSFIALNLAGAITGVAAAIEHRTSGTLAMLIRTWRPRLAYLHILLFWPIPVLIAYHVAAFYYF